MYIIQSGVVWCGGFDCVAVECDVIHYDYCSKIVVYVHITVNLLLCLCTYSFKLDLFMRWVCVQPLNGYVKVFSVVTVLGLDY